mmetsp:Transcript_28606/g.68182  ORF Transcript_28606/g.68182 Transcript_28606/m.68182 type:complete len:316 (-) Transcript_28606:305-1252(-)
MEIQAREVGEGAEAVRDILEQVVAEVQPAQLCQAADLQRQLPELVEVKPQLLELPQHPKLRWEARDPVVLQPQPTELGKASKLGRQAVQGVLGQPQLPERRKLAESGRELPDEALLEVPAGFAGEGGAPQGPAQSSRRPRGKRAPRAEPRVPMALTGIGRGRLRPNRRPSVGVPIAVVFAGFDGLLHGGRREVPSWETREGRGASFACVRGGWPSGRAAAGLRSEPPDPSESPNRIPPHPRRKRAQKGAVPLSAPPHPWTPSGLFPVAGGGEEGPGAGRRRSGFPGRGRRGSRASRRLRPGSGIAEPVRPTGRGS